MVCAHEDPLLVDVEHGVASERWAGGEVAAAEDGYEKRGTAAEVGAGGVEGEVGALGAWAPGGGGPGEC